MSPSIPRRRQAALLAGLLILSPLTGAGLAGEVREELSHDVETEVPAARQSALERGGEALPMHWRLSGFLGVLASLFVPSHGDAVLTFVPAGEDRLEVELLVTAPRRESEYFLYGAEIDRSTGATAQVWSSYRFGEKSVDREQTVDEPDIIDFASAIHRLRIDPPEHTRRLRIWNAGRTYPVDVEPLGRDRRKISGEKMDVVGFLVRGVKLKGERYFDDKFSVYFRDDDGLTPVEILGHRGWVRVRFELAPDAAGPEGGAR